MRRALLCRVPRKSHDLALYEIAIRTFAAHQNIERAVLNDSARVEYDDAVEVAQG